MIHCVTQPLEKYDVILSGYSVGIYSNYGHDPHLFNLLTRCNRVPFQYEEGSNVLTSKVLSTIFDIELYEETLEQDVGDKNVRALLEELNPEQMLNWFQNYDVGHLGVTLYYENETSLFLVMAARVAQWKKYYRGVIKSEKGLISASFGNRLTNEEEEVLRIVNCYKN